MPVLNGFDTLQELQRNPDSRYIPVVMVSSDSDVDSVIKALSMGASDYLKKPFAAAELLASTHYLDPSIIVLNSRDLLESVLLHQTVDLSAYFSKSVA